MLEIKTKLTSIKLGENISISRKGKNPLQEEYRKLFLDYLNVSENSLYLVVGIYKGAYHVNIKLNLTEEMKDEILEWYRKDKSFTNNISIKAEKITIKEIY